MVPDPEPLPAERIDQALARIEAAARQLVVANQRLADRHRALRDSMATAIAAIDDAIAQAQAR